MVQLSTGEVGALHEALDDEYKAWVIYAQRTPAIALRRIRGRFTGSHSFLYIDASDLVPEANQRADQKANAAHFLAVSIATRPL
jgi:hypothetical protein